MERKCPNCGTYYDANDPVCPGCGKKYTTDSPQTIEDLRAWCEARNLTPERTRFFIGINYTEPKAFGIYQNDEGNYVVYKNKADGSRAIRYEGQDEAFAVSELYDRLQQEIENQRNLSASRHIDPDSVVSRPSYEYEDLSDEQKSYEPEKKKSSGDKSPIFLWLLVMVIALALRSCGTGGGSSNRGSGNKSGYYQNDNHYDNDWDFDWDTGGTDWDSDW